MKELWLTRVCVWLCRRIGETSATWPRITIIACILLTALLSIKAVTTKQVSSMDGWSSDNARSRYEYNVFQEFLNADGLGITLALLLRAQDNQSMIRMEYMEETIDFTPNWEHTAYPDDSDKQSSALKFAESALFTQSYPSTSPTDVVEEILEYVSSEFPMYDADLGKNQSFYEFCHGFCQANEPVRLVYNILRLSEGNVSEGLRQRVNLSYPTSEIFSTKFSLLPSFFGVEMEENGTSIKSVTLINLLFRAERHPSWTVDMVKEWEVSIEEYFSRHYDQSRIDVSVLSTAIVENEIVRAGESLMPFLVVGFAIMCIFCTTTTMASSIVMYNHKATFNKVIISVTACIIPFMACGTGLGAIFLLGATFSPILQITPFLVLAISVDDSFLMIHAWHRISKSSLKNNELAPSRAKMMGQVLVETGPAIAISAFTNMFAFAIGAYTSPFEIRMFSIGNAACIFMDMCYQLTFYTALMTLFADFPQDHGEKEKCSRLREAAQSLLRWYTGFISKFKVSLMVVLVWILFVAGAVVGSFYANVDLSSRKMFLPDSKLVEVDDMRNKYMVPAYTPARIVLSKPGNLSDPENIKDLLDMKNAFENLPHAIGPESTKFLVNEFVRYREALHDELGQDPSAGTLQAFLHWPEYSYYQGFVKQRNASESDDVKQLMFVTGFHGEQLVSWDEKSRLLNSWRREADRYMERFNVTVFSEEGFFIDLLKAIPVLTWQSGLATFICVIIICALFINHPATILFVAMSILATCIGVFGYLSLFRVSLDPIVMSISIMCIGFSVDIPAHVSFHYHASRAHVAKLSTCSTIASTTGDGSNTKTGEESDFRLRLQYTLRSVGFPVLQAGISTILCALPLAFVPLYMAQVFSLAMVMCISFSLTHGIIVLPAIFCLYDRASIAVRTWISATRRKTRCAPA